jgi:hypothetical protein
LPPFRMAWWVATLQQPPAEWLSSGPPVRSTAIDEAAEAILEERRKGPFLSFTDFALRLDSHLVNKRTLDALICAGSFDSLGRNRATLAAASERVFARAARAREEQEIGQSTLFGGSAEEPLPAGEDFPDLPEWSLEERLKGEKDVLGFYVTGHPLTRFAEAIERFADVRVSELSSQTDKTVRVGGVLVGLKKQKIKKGLNEGKTMLKAVLEDMTEVPATRGADDLRAHNPVARVDARLDRLELRRLDEARPAGARVELRVGAEQLRPAPRAAVDPRLLGVGVRARERPFGRLLPQHGVLLRREALAPLLVRQLDASRHHITTSETATNWVTAATTTRRWKTSWKPRTRGNGSGHLVA